MLCWGVQVMTKFEELQQDHQRLLDRVDDVADKAAFAREVQDYVKRVCDEAVDVPDPRDRDQLRANLRFWASYIYDATGTYPNTTLRPPRLQSVSYAPSIPPAAQPKSTASARRPMLIGLGIIAVLSLIFITLFLLAGQGERAPIDVTNLAVQATNAAAATLYATTPTPPANTSTPTSSPAPTATRALIRPPIPTEEPGSSGAVSIDWAIVTQGPSPFDPNTWVARIKLSGQGGNGAYIYWVDGQRLPDASDGEFTMEGQGCEAKRAEVGVTSDGQTASQSLEIKSPLSQCR
jgi:hypothetical protein